MNKKIIKSFVFLGVFVVGFLFLLTRCQKNVVTEQTKDNYIEKAKAWFNTHPEMNQFAVLSFSEKADWSKAFYHKKGNEVAIELPLKLKKGMAVMIRDTVEKNAINRIVFVMNKENKVKSFYELIKPENEHIETPEKINYFNVPNNFTGTIMLTNTNAGVKQFRHYQHGKPYHFKSEGKLVYYYCWRIVQLYSDGSYEPVTGWICDTNEGGGNSDGHGGGGSSNGKGTGSKPSKPCPGDPVKNPEIAAQLGASGLSGGEFGCTRYDQNDICGGVKGKKFHNGLDIKNAYGNPDYAMYGGTAVLRTQYRNGKVVGAGYYVDVTSVINGQTVHSLYFHMKKDGRVSGQVKAGDVIGYQGNSGNLKAAIYKGSAVSHVHIKVKVNGKAVDPEPYFATKFGADGKGPNPCGN